MKGQQFMSPGARPTQKVKTKADISKQIFDAYSYVYDSVVNYDFLIDNDKCRTKFIEFIYNEFKKKKNINILDVGCGSGVPALFLIEAGFYNVYGFDISEGMIQRLKDVGRKTIDRDKPVDEQYKWDDRFWVMNWDDIHTDYRLKLDNNEEKFDLIIFRGAGADLCEDMKRLEILLHNMIELIKPDGKILVGLRNWETRNREIVENINDYKEKKKGVHLISQELIIPKIRSTDKHYIIEEFANKPVSYSQSGVQILFTVIYRYYYNIDHYNKYVENNGNKNQDKILDCVDFIFLKTDESKDKTDTLIYNIDNLMVSEKILLSIIRNKMSGISNVEFIPNTNEQMAGNYHNHYLMSLSDD